MEVLVLKKINLLLAGLLTLGLTSCGRGSLPMDTLPTNVPNVTPSVRPKPTPTPTPDITETDTNTGTDTTPDNPDIPDNPDVPTRKDILKDGRVGYQIFVNTFADGDKSNNKVTDSGDIQGIIDKLDDLKNYLNVEVLWLTPIHNATSYNGYDPSDYRSVKQAFGGMDKYEELLEEAHKRGMYVMLDLVVNHTSSSHFWFQQSKSSKDNPYRDYYRWSDNDHSSKYWYPSTEESTDEYYYALFWDQMPDLNYDSPALYNEMLDICNSWIEKGIDGFRIDGAKHVYNHDPNYGGYEITSGAADLAKLNRDKNLEFFNKLNADLKKNHPDTFLTLEVLDTNTDHTSAYLNQGVDSCFDFAGRDIIINNIQNPNGPAIAYGFDANQNKYNANNQFGLNSVILGNHDLDRVMSKLNHNEEQAKAAAAIQMLLPGLAWIYNGDELGMSGSEIKGVKNGDLGYRQPYKWGDDYTTKEIELKNVTNGYDNYNKALNSFATQKDDENSMLNFYKKMTTLKATDDVIRNGSYTPLDLNSKAVTFLRSLNGKNYLCAVNVSGEQLDINYDYTDAKAVSLTKAAFKDSKLTLSAYGVAVIELKSTTPEIECESVVVNYKGSDGYQLYSDTFKPGRFFDFAEGENGFKKATIDIKGLNLSSINLAIAKQNEDGTIDYLTESARFEIICDHETKVCTITIDTTLTEYHYKIKIDDSWGVNTHNERFMIWAWKEGKDGFNGAWYEATANSGYIEFTLDKNINRAIIVVFSKNASTDWKNITKQSIDLTLVGGTLVTPLEWKNK